MHLIVLLLFLIKTTGTIRIGRILNATWIFNSSNVTDQYMNISNTTCEQCLCQMLSINDPNTSIACQPVLKTCQFLFLDITSQLQADNRSIVYIQKIPLSSQVTASFSSTDLATVSTESATTMVSSSTVINTTPRTTTSTTTTRTTSTTTSTTTTSTTSTTTSTTITSTTSTTTSTTTTRNLTSNFLINPGGESGTLSPWISSSAGAPIVSNGSANGNNIPPYNGMHAFFGGSGGGSLRQRITLNSTFSSAQLDSSSLFASISFWERTWDQSPSDAGQVYLSFLSGTNTVLSNVTTGQKSCVPAWCYVAMNSSIPVGTRTIEYMMTFIRATGGTADVWIDDNMLMIF